MRIEAEVIADSICNGYRITSFRVVFPRFILAECNTHGSICRSTSSSRAVPVQKQLERLREFPFVPTYLGKNKKGMQATEEVSEEAKEAIRDTWLRAKDSALSYMDLLQRLGLHKQHSSRLGEPWMWSEATWTATEWDNFFALRNHSNAQPEFHELAACMFTSMHRSSPQVLEPGEWHLPFIKEHEFKDHSLQNLARVSVARCARTSYYLQSGKVSDIQDDLAMCSRLLEAGHMAPAEHPAEAVGYFKRYARYMGWRSFRHTQPNECHGDYTKEKYQALGANLEETPP
jgi:thymidylate synthase ThyX